ncbi:MAG: hypothetical protein GTO14_10820 [Anaerolineales bacterium]|nr:hypothetical protein [Anaerolineales bacterium]
MRIRYSTMVLLVALIPILVTMVWIVLVETGWLGLLLGIPVGYFVAQHYMEEFLEVIELAGMVKPNPSEEEEILRGIAYAEGGGKGALAGAIMSVVGFLLATFVGGEPFTNLVAGAGSMGATTMIILAVAARRLEGKYWGN